jgi:hypothetical protein
MNLILLLLLPIFFYSCVDSMIFLPPAASYQRSSSLIMIPVENGQQIAAYYLPPENGDFVVLFSHGNAEDIGQNLGFFQEYQMQEVGILGYDYRGYGLSDGKASEQNTYRDIAAAYNYLIDQQQIAPERILLFWKARSCRRFAFAPAGRSSRLTNTTTWGASKTSIAPCWSSTAKTIASSDSGTGKHSMKPPPNLKCTTGYPTPDIITSSTPPAMNTGNN